MDRGLLDLRNLGRSLVPESDYSIPLPPDGKYAQGAIKRQRGCKVPNRALLIGMGHSGVLSVIWGEGLAGKVGEKKTFLASAL